MLTFAGLLLATSFSMAQVKMGANPGTIGTNSGLEVEATNGKKTIVNKATGQVTIQDGTEGAGKVLISDANGGSSGLHLQLKLHLCKLNLPLLQTSLY